MTMSTILVVIGSARKGRVAEKITEYTVNELAKFEGVNTKIADLAEYNLPFFDNERAPADPEYVPSSDAVAQWASDVASADGVVFITPEYNHNLSAIQKNAIDSLGKEWVEKPVTAIAYGWYAGEHSLAAIRELAPVIKIDLKPTPAQLAFTKDITTDGTAIDEAAVTTKIAAALREIVT